MNDPLSINRPDMTLGPSHRTKDRNTLETVAQMKHIAEQR